MVLLLAPLTTATPSRTLPSAEVPVLATPILFVTRVFLVVPLSVM